MQPSRSTRLLEEPTSHGDVAGLTTVLLRRRSSPQAGLSIAGRCRPGAFVSLASVGPSGSARAAGRAGSVVARSGPRFDPDLARELQRALRDALSAPSVHAPGAILHVRSRRLGRWTGAAGLGRVAPAEPCARADRFRAGSIAKPFVAVVVLQLAERGRLSLDAPLPEVLPASVVGRFAERGRDLGPDAARPPQRGPGMGQPRQDDRSRVIPRRCGRSPSSSISRRPSRRCSRPERATRTPTPTTTCSA